MSRRAKLGVAGILGGIGLIVVLFAIFGSQGIRSHLDDTYQRVSSQGNSVVYRSSEKPKAAYDDIRSAVSPADVVLEPEGYFLRYSNDIVAVTADGTGSKIYLDDERRGHGLWLPFVVGYWGTGGGFGEGIRGGGPGAGK